MVTSETVDDSHGLMLMAVLQESVRTRGERATAKWLDVDRRTLLSCVEQGELSLKVRVALDKQVRREANAETVAIGEGLQAQGAKIDEVATKIESFGTDFERLETMIKAVRQESAKELRTLVRRVERLEKGVAPGAGTGSEQRESGGARAVP